MQRPSGWMVAAMGLALVIAFLVYTAPWMAKACEGPSAAPQFGSTAASCFEFWLNRYQQLIGAFTAIVAAFIAGWFVLLQTAVTRRQLAVSALPELDRRAKILTQLINDVVELQDIRSRTYEAAQALVAHFIERIQRKNYSQADARVQTQRTGVITKGCDDFTAYFRKTESNLQHLIIRRELRDLLARYFSDLAIEADRYRGIIDQWEVGSAVLSEDRDVELAEHMSRHMEADLPEDIDTLAKALMDEGRRQIGFLVTMIDTSLEQLEGRIG